LLNAKGVWSFPASEVRAVDASGAGDAFNAAIIFSMLNDFSDAETGVFANLFAGYTVRTVGTTNALPPREVIKEMIQQVTGIDSAGYRK
jgi:sugar/nucleoside kinase (ribokinase family)